MLRLPKNSLSRGQPLELYRSKFTIPTKYHQKPGPVSFQVQSRRLYSSNADTQKPDKRFRGSEDCVLESPKASMWGIYIGWTLVLGATMMYLSYRDNVENLEWKIKRLEKENSKVDSLAYETSCKVKSLEWELGFLKAKVDSWGSRRSAYSTEAPVPSTIFHLISTTSSKTSQPSSTCAANLNIQVNFLNPMLTRFHRAVLPLSTVYITPTTILPIRFATMADDDDLSSLGFTSFGKTKTSHSSMPIHANPTPLPQSLPPQHQNSHHHQQQHFHRGGGGGGGYRGNNRGNYRGGFDNNNRGGGGGPHRSRGFHSNPNSNFNSRGGGGGRGRGGGGGRGGRGGHHHHPYHQQQQQQQQRQFSTSVPQVAAYHSKLFGEGLYKPSMNEDPWRELRGNNNTTATTESKSGGPAAAVAGDVWLGENTEQDKSNWYDKPEDKAADGGGWNEDEIDLDDDEI
ncbi:hypothetical protein AA313_de0208793 [Arthrobotrys entomopaga]|nr:hypothetical protein AA313_de0208793 [Arthrobotrys entomopaga]